MRVWDRYSFLITAVVVIVIYVAILYSVLDAYGGWWFAVGRRVLRCRRQLEDAATSLAGHVVLAPAREGRSPHSGRFGAVVDWSRERRCVEMTKRVRFIEVAVALAGFGAFGGVVLLTDAPRGIVLPAWIGVTLALAAYGHRHGTWLPRSIRPQE